MVRAAMEQSELRSSEGDEEEDVLNMTAQMSEMGIAETEEVCPTHFAITFLPWTFLDISGFFNHPKN